MEETNAILRELAASLAVLPRIAVALEALPALVQVVNEFSAYSVSRSARRDVVADVGRTSGGVSGRVVAEGEAGPSGLRREDEDEEDDDEEGTACGD